MWTILGASELQDDLGFSHQGREAELPASMECCQPGPPSPTPPICVACERTSLASWLGEIYLESNLPHNTFFIIF